MDQAKVLQEFIGEGNETDVFVIARYIEAHIAENWESVLEQNRAKLLDVYNRLGDEAYGTYLSLLFRPVHKQLKANGLRPLPLLPGKFDISREWGVAEQNDEQRWIWSTIKREDGESLGTIVTIVYHDHTQFRLPRKPEILALTETGKNDVVEALSLRSEDFKNAREAKIEIAEYLASLENQS